MCRTGCLTQDHESWGACLRAANIDVNSDIKGIAARKVWDRECHDYADLRRQGLQPQGTTRKHIETARTIADKVHG